VLPFLHGQTHLLRHNVRRMSKRNKGDACDDDGTGIGGGTPMFMAPEVTQGAAAEVFPKGPQGEVDRGAAARWSSSSGASAPACGGCEVVGDLIPETIVNPLL
jgi:hypothetical protein